MVQHVPPHRPAIALSPAPPEHRIHRDVKAANILLSADGRVKVGGRAAGPLLHIPSASPPAWRGSPGSAAYRVELAQRTRQENRPRPVQAAAQRNVCLPLRSPAPAGLRLWRLRTARRHGQQAAHLCGQPSVDGARGGPAAACRGAAGAARCLCSNARRLLSQEQETPRRRQLLGTSAPRNKPGLGAQ